MNMYNRNGYGKVAAAYQEPAMLPAPMAAEYMEPACPEPSTMGTMAGAMEEHHMMTAEMAEMMADMHRLCSETHAMVKTIYNRIFPKKPFC